MHSTNSEKNKYSIQGYCRKDKKTFDMLNRASHTIQDVLEPFLYMEICALVACFKYHYFKSRDNSDENKMKYFEITDL